MKDLTSEDIRLAGSKVLDEDELEMIIGGSSGPGYHDDDYCHIVAHCYVALLHYDDSDTNPDWQDESCFANYSCIIAYHH